MPLISNMNISSGDIVSSEDLYENGLFNPKDTPDNLEILNGGLDLENFGAGNFSIEPYMCQFGSFALGYFSGFEREHAVYARQVSSDIGSNTQQHVVHSALSASIYLPWKASVLMYGYQGFFPHDATMWETSGTASIEYWKLKLLRRNLGGASDEKEESRTVLPWSRDNTQSATNSSVVDPGIAFVQNWKYVHKHQMETDVPKGNHEFEVQVESGIKYPDYALAKVETVIGGFYVLAIR